MPAQDPRPLPRQLDVLSFVTFRAVWAMPYLLLEGKADHYEHFLTAATNTNLSDISEDFHFQIRAIEGPTLLVRHVRTYGQASNHGELSDAFYALMLSYPPGEFSSVAPLADPGQPTLRPTLHWHLANQSCVNHHRNSKVTYLRLESAGLLRALAAQAIAVSQLTDLQGMVAPTSLVQLIQNLGQQLSSTEPQQHPPISEAFLNRLAQELRQLLGPPRASDANAAAHTSRAIEWMMDQLSAPIGLQQLAKQLALTPRTVQSCFKSQLALSPMRWLKLARLSRLRQLLWDLSLAQESIQQLFGHCGLSDTGLNRISFREVYGLTPREQRRQAREIVKQHQAGNKESLHRQFDCLETAIDYLKTYRESQDMDDEKSHVVITITRSNHRTRLD